MPYCILLGASFTVINTKHNSYLPRIYTFEGKQIFKNTYKYMCTYIYINTHVDAFIYTIHKLKIVINGMKELNERPNLGQLRMTFLKK
jgi:hypothetical protein